MRQEGKGCDRRAKEGKEKARQHDAGGPMEAGEG